MPAEAPAAALTATDPRVKAFVTPNGPEVFSAIVHGSQVWEPDPFDVEVIHAEARSAFARLLDRASAPVLPPHGKCLLLLGEGGSGKTHLLRSFRSAAHADGAGYCAYLQMTTRADNYAGYILSNVVDSLERPYKPGSPESGLGRLARGLLDALDAVPAEDRRRLADDYLEPDELARLVHRLADLAVQYPQFRGIDIDLIRAILFTIPSDGRVRSRTLKWLRCEDLSKYDRELVGDLVPRPGPEMPMRTLVGLGRLMHAVHTAAFVVMVDQIEQVLDLEQTGEAEGEVLRRMVNTLVDVMDAVPNAVVVVASLEDLFKTSRQHLPKAKLDRLERDPDPVRLSGRRTPTEITAVIGRRLEVLFDAAGVEADTAEPTAPYVAADIAGLTGFSPRDILDNLRRHREKCMLAGQWLSPEWTTEIIIEKKRDWPLRWNDFHAAYKAAVLDDEPKLASLLGSALKAASGEVPPGVHFAPDPDGRFLPVEVHTPGNAVDKLFVAVCDRSTRGGGLGNQVKEVMQKAGDNPAVLVRSTNYPSDAKLVVAKDIAKLVAPVGKGRRVVVADSDWRAMAAFREFHAAHAADPGFADWQRADKPLSSLASVREILAVVKLPAAPTAPANDPPVPPVGVAKPTPEVVTPPVVPAVPPASPSGAVRLGLTRGSTPAPVDLTAASLCRHAAFLGGSGSGKTTAALSIIEQLLLLGVPTVLLDRKGDLARYADPAAWDGPDPDADRKARRDRLRAAVDVALYTPGAGDGRPLVIPVVPDLAGLSTTEREQHAQYAAAGLAQMMGYKRTNTDPKVAILQKTIEVAARGGAVTVKRLHALLDDMDDDLVNETSGFEEKEFKKLGQNLLTLSHQHRRLLEGGEPLDVDGLLGRGAHAVPGKTRLTVINTQFLGDGATDFWVAQFLLCVDRWRSKNPAAAGVLQAVFLFDEADQYLPATAKPATKGPMEGLLKRARSAGVGVFLATQSPGDLDYKCRDQVLTWLLGRVKEPVAIAKLKPMLEARPDAADKLAGQSAGEFYLVRENGVGPVKAARNLIETAQVPEDRILELARLGRPT